MVWFCFDRIQSISTFWPLSLSWPWEVETSVSPWGATLPRIRHHRCSFQFSYICNHQGRLLRGGGLEGGRGLISGRCGVGIECQVFSRSKSTRILPVSMRRQHPCMAQTTKWTSSPRPVASVVGPRVLSSQGNKGSADLTQEREPRKMEANV